jgi:hypothetical protein
VKIKLIHEFTKFDFPFFEILDIITVKLFGLELWTHELNSVWSFKDFFLSFGFGPEDLENGVKGDDEALTRLTVFGMMVKNTSGSEYKNNGL